MPTIRDLQVKLPWTTHYHKDFRSNPMTHKDFSHALLHIYKAAGKLAAVIDDAEHGGSEFKSEEVDPYIADLVICALRMANTCPGRTIDLEAAVIDRIEKKNNIRLNRTRENDPGVEVTPMRDTDTMESLFCDHCHGMGRHDWGCNKSNTGSRARQK